MDARFAEVSSKYEGVHHQLIQITTDNQKLLKMIEILVKGKDAESYPHEQQPESSQHIPAALVMEADQHACDSKTRVDQLTKVPRMDFPEVVGEDPTGWVSRCNTYFELYDVFDDVVKVKIARLYL